MQKKALFLRLTRFLNSEKGTLGNLELFEWNDYKLKCVYSCQTLEPAVPSLPVGHYILKSTFSPKFSNKEPYAKLNNGNVPIISRILNGPSIEHRGIRIHCGNNAFDTSGCILVGVNKIPGKYVLFDSRITYNVLMSFIKDASNEILLTITDDILPF